MRRRGQQSGTEASIFILVITVLIVIYIMFLPAEQRRELLDSTDNNGKPHNNEDKYNLTLVDESPGRLEVYDHQEFEHDLPSINLYSKTNAQVVESMTPFVIKNSWFDKKFETISFNLQNKDEMDNLQLSFIAKQHKGTLLITLNGFRIFEGETDTQTIDPVNLPKEKLDSVNTIEFSVSSVGLAFWSTNKFGFENMVITADITDSTGQVSQNVFTLKEEEFLNLENAQLNFVPECTLSEVGVLTASINGEKVYSGVPDCGSFVPAIEITHAIKPSQNTIEFMSQKGNILIDNLRVHTFLKDIIYPVYYFELTDEQYDDILDNRTELNMTLRFTDNDELKESKIYVNGAGPIYAVTKDNEYTRVLSPPLIKRKSNSIRIEPYRDVLDILQVLVYLE